MATQKIRVGYIDADGASANQAILFDGTNVVWSNVATSGGGGSGGGFYQGNNGDVGSTNFGDIFRTHTNTLTGNVIIPSSNNSIAAGPLIIADGASLTIQSNARVAIV